MDKKQMLDACIKATREILSHQVEKNQEDSWAAWFARWFGEEGEIKAYANGTRIDRAASLTFREWRSVTNTLPVGFELRLECVCPEGRFKTGVKTAPNKWDTVSSLLHPERITEPRLIPGIREAAARILGVEQDGEFHHWFHAAVIERGA